MILGIINRIIRSRVKTISFPKLPAKEYNKLWKITINKFIKLPIIDIITIIKCLIFKFGPSSLIAIPSIILIIKKSGILSDKDTESHLKMFKALDVDNNNIEFYFKTTLIFSLIVKWILFIILLLWLPLKIALLLYLLDYLNYDISFIYYKLNNLSLGILDWYYRTLIDLIESFRYKTILI